MKIATWNVNSLRVRLPHLLDWLATVQPEIVCLQETKTEDVNFPEAEIAAAGYQVIYSGQKTYNGVAILSKTVAQQVVTTIPDFADEQKRVLAASYGAIRVICGYFPNGQSVDSDKYQYKLQWLQALHRWVASELRAHPWLLLLGDYNIAPEDRDVHDPVAWEGNVLVSPAERQAFRDLLGCGLVDAFRLFEQPVCSYSWWDYRMAAFRRNLGMRIDHILISDPLAEKVRACWVDTAPRRLERPSDHAPVVVEMESLV